MITLFTRGCQPSAEDLRWIDEQMILPATPVTTNRPCKGEVLVRLPTEKLHRIGTVLVDKVQQQLGLSIWAITLQRWYAHLLLAGSLGQGRALVECASQAVCEVLGGPKSAWSPQYVVRYCFDSESVHSWASYIRLHNEAMGWPANPYPGIHPIELPPQQPDPPG